MIGNSEESHNPRLPEEFSPVITSIHTLIYSDDAPATRAFLRDVLGWPHVEDALGGGAGWLIFKTGPSEMGVHPTHSVYDGKTYEAPRHHLISLMCDDISRTVIELKGKGAEFRGEVKDYGYGLVVMMAVPGADDIVLYEPRHPPAYSL
jgi:catechol 2,3-dioxygenase-like lactoylglutathione lyase family enzyme